MKKKVIIGLIVIVIIALIIFFNLQVQRERAIKVKIEKVKTHNLTSIVSASGEVKPRKNINISAHIPGRVVKIGVEEGQYVNKGDFLLKLDSTQYEAYVERDRAMIASLQADLIQARARLKRDEQAYQRAKKLHRENLISDEQLENAKTQHEISLASYQAITHRIDEAKASLQSSLDNLNKTVYHSPIDGIITSLRIEEGEVVITGTMNNPGTVLMTIADLSVMEVEVEVDETDVIAVELEQPSEVRVDALPERIIKGKVTEVGSSALAKLGQVTSEEAKDFKVVITLIDSPKTLKPGLSASADIITAKRENVLAVPISSLVLKEEEKEDKKKEEKEGVYIVKEGRAYFQPVEKGIMGEMMVEIKSGLKEGQEVIVGPYSALRQLKDGRLIKSEEKSSS
ncbi:MAG: efflux RND transporter periplasmic adaptor subunit [Candidatus Aminicenantia bacterium]